MALTDCIHCTPIGDCGWQRNEQGNALIPCNPQGCKDYDPRATPEEIRKEAPKAQADKEYDELRAEGYRSHYEKRLVEEMEERALRGD